METFKLFIADPTCFYQAVIHGGVDSISIVSISKAEGVGVWVVLNCSSGMLFWLGYYFGYFSCK